MSTGSGAAPAHRAPAADSHDDGGTEPAGGGRPSHRPESTRIVVAARGGMVLAALVSALDGTPGLQVVAGASEGTRALEEIRRTKPDVVVIEPVAPGPDGLRVCAEVKRVGAAPGVVILAEDESAADLLLAVEAGADGYVAMSSGLDALRTAVRRVGAGEADLPPLMLANLLQRLVGRPRHEDAMRDRVSLLTKREWEVLGLLVAGLDNRGMARVLVVSPHTVRTHVQNVLEKLRVHSRLEAARLAAEHELVERFLPAERAGGHPRLAPDERARRDSGQP